MAVFNNILAGASGQTTGGGGGYEIERSLRFNSSDSAYLSRVFSSTGNQKIATFAFWVKRTTLGAAQYIYDSTSTNTTIFFSGDDKLCGNLRGTGGTNYTWTTNAVFRDASAWYHIVVAWDSSQATAANRCRVYVNGTEQSFSSVSYCPQDTILFTNDTRYIGQEDSVFGLFNGYLADIHFIDGQALDPSSFGEFDTNNVWQPIDASGLTFGTNGFRLPFSDNSTAAALGTDTSSNGNTWTVNNLSVSNATVNATAQLSNLIGTPTAPTTNATMDIGDIGVAGVPNPGNAAYLKFNFSALGLIAPATITFKSYQQGGGGWSVVPSTIYTDAGNVTSAFTFSGNTRFNTVNIPAGATYFALPPSWTSVAGGIVDNAIGSLVWDGVPVVNYSPSFNDSLVDSPVNGSQVDTGVGGEVVGNYATLNPLDLATANTLAPTNGNLEQRVFGGSSTWGSARGGTFTLTSGKWYWECVVRMTFPNNNGPAIIGILQGNLPGSYVTSGANALGVYYQAYLGQKYVNGVSSSYGTSWSNAATDYTLGVALDIDGGTITFYLNGVSQGAITLYSNSNGWKPHFAYNSSYGASEYTDTTWNFGQRPFAYPLSGFKALCTTNLPEPTIADGSTAFETVLWTGDGTNNRKITTPFSPDFVWAKFRNQSFSHGLYDTVRGDDKRLVSNSTDAEATVALGMESDGFVVEGSSSYNDNNDLFVAWTWDAGSSTVTNNDGSITSQVRANPGAGFSIVTYTGNSAQGATVGHGLNVAPALYFVKARSRGGSWLGQHTSIVTANHYIKLNESTAYATASSIFPQKPTSSLLYLGNEPEVNNNSDTFVAYCFAPVDGYSSFGSYTGNGSTDGPFVYTGFRPKYLLWKVTQANGNSANWYTLDAATSPYNEARNRLHPNTSSTEATMSTGIDFLSNGFKLRTSGTDINGAYTYIYAAFAEHPFATSRAR